MMPYASACEAVENGIASGEVQLGLVDGDLGIARSVCPTTRVGFTAGGAAIIETENLYGRILGTGTLKGSLALSKRSELYLSIEGLRYDSIIAPISSSGLGPGYTAVGAGTQLVNHEPMTLAVQGKVVLPTAFTIDTHGAPLAMDAGLVGSWSPTVHWTVHGSVMGMYSMAVGGGPLFPRGGVTLDVGGEWRPTFGFSVVVDGRTGFLYTDALDVVSAGIGIRGAIGHHAGLALEAVKPLAGRERTLAGAELRFDWRI